MDTIQVEICLPFNPTTMSRPSTTIDIAHLTHIIQTGVTILWSDLPAIKELDTEEEYRDAQEIVVSGEALVKFLGSSSPADDAHSSTEQPSGRFRF